MLQDSEVYRYETMYLPEFKSIDCAEFIACTCDRLFAAKDSILLGIYAASRPEEFLGICEIYAYDAERNKVSLGYRLRRQSWHQGIATKVVAMAKDYLFQKLTISEITAHVRIENVASAKCLLKNGFTRLRALPEDWGLAKPCLAYKFVLYQEQEKIT